MAKAKLEYQGWVSIGRKVCPLGFAVDIMSKPQYEVITRYGEKLAFEYWSVMVTPETAQAILPDLNRANRAMKFNSVARMKQDMSAGYWEFNNVELVAFDSCGVLLDAQHRIEAVLDSGVAVPMKLVFGCDPNLRRVLNTTTGRTLADQMVLMGERWVKATHTACGSFMLNYRKNSDDSRLAAWYFITKHKKAIQFVVGELAGTTALNMRPAYIAAALTRASYFMSRSDMQRFIDVYLGGVSHGCKDSGATYLREYVREKKMYNEGGDPRKRGYFTAEACLQAFIDGKAMGPNIPLPGGELFLIPGELRPRKYFGGGAAAKP